MTKSECRMSNVEECRPFVIRDFVIRHFLIGAACRCCPDESSLEDSHVPVTSMPRRRVIPGFSPSGPRILEKVGFSKFSAFRTEARYYSFKWSLELVARQPLRIFNPPLICLSHPA